MSVLPTPSFRGRDRAWARPIAAIGVVALATALGALIGLLLGMSVQALWPESSRTGIEVLTAVLGFGLAWWWFVAAGQRWITGDDRDARSGGGG
jgi:protein-S-isoprenylcysteine O-methyltransferase Ste14